jgi:hypothetical protein
LSEHHQDPRFNHGDPIRLVRIEVAVETDGKTTARTQTIRWPMENGQPVHSCIASTCAECLSRAEAKAIRRATRASGKTAAASVRVTETTVLRDRLTTYRDPQILADEQLVKTTQLERELAESFALAGA